MGRKSCGMAESLWGRDRDRPWLGKAANISLPRHLSCMLRLAGKADKRKNHAANCSGHGLSRCAEVFDQLWSTQKDSLCAASIQQCKAEGDSGGKQRKISAACLQSEMSFLLRVPELIPGLTAG